MNEDIKNDLLECLLVTSTGLSLEETAEQAQREIELTERLKAAAKRGYIMTGKRLFTDDPKS